MKFISFLKLKSKLLILRTNLFIFLVFSVVISLITEKLPKCFYFYDTWLYREKKWEKGGIIYERLFLVKKWKDKLPEISDFIKCLFVKKHLKSTKTNYLRKFLLESCKSELTHWLIILSSFTFIFWTDFMSMVRVLIIATILNLPYIIIQRYNRPRIIKLMKKNVVHDYELSTVKI